MVTCTNWILRAFVNGIVLLLALLHFELQLYPFFLLKDLIYNIEIGSLDKTDKEIISIVGPEIFEKANLELIKKYKAQVEILYKLLEEVKE